jgi:hypothetical protein
MPKGLLNRNNARQSIMWMSNKTQQNEKDKRQYDIMLKKQTIGIPKPISIYNSYMGGTDLLEQAIATYSANIRSKKW